MASKSKKIGVIVFGLIVVIAIVGILMNNRSKNLAKSKENVVMQNYPVTIAKVEIKSINEALSVIGTLTPNAEVQIISETPGKITGLFTDVGQNISKGGQIAKLDDELKQANLITAQANFDKAKKDLDRYEQLNKEKSINDAQLDQIKLVFKTAEAQLIIAKKQLADTKIVAPFSGTVTSRMVELGTVVSSNTVIATIVDVSNMKIKVNLAEGDVFKLKQGDEVIATTDVYPGIDFKGRVKSVNAKGDESHTFPVEVSLPNSSKTPLKAGMFARINFTTVKKSETMVIPRVALVGSIKNASVYVVENNIAKLKSITIGSENGDELEIKAGLNPGEFVVINGQVNLRDNTPVSIANQVK